MGKGQHGFCKGKKSCSAEVLEFFEGVSNHINKGSSVAAASLDFQKTRPLTKDICLKGLRRLCGQRRGPFMGEILAKKEKNSSNYFYSCLRSLEEHIRVLCWDLCCIYS